MDEQPDSSQQLMDILLVMDEQKKTIQAVCGVKDGELKTQNPLDGNNDLLKLNRHGDMFTNFFANLWSQLKDPTRFHFFRVPEEEMQKVAADFQQTIEHPTPEGEARMKQYEVQPPMQQQAQEQQPQQAQQPVGEQQTPQYKYNPEDIDWGTLASLGVQRKQIEDNGMLDQMLRGFQTDRTVRVHFNLGTLSHSNDSQLSLKPNADGKLSIVSHGILDPDKVQKQFFGYELTDKDTQAIKTVGNVGHPVTVTNRAGEEVQTLVSRNLKTNELAAYPIERINIPAEKNGHTFTPEEIAKLKQGEAVVCRFMPRGKEGEEAKELKPYDAPVQFNAAKMKLEFLFGERGREAMEEHRKVQKETANLEAPKMFRKQELTEKARLELEGGGTVKIAGLVDKKGKAYHGYITWKPGEKPNFMFPKDYKDALDAGRVKPAIENEVQVAVNSQGKTTEATKDLKEALRSAQTQPTEAQKEKQEQKEEQRQQQEQQPDTPKRSRGVRR